MQINIDKKYFFILLGAVLLAGGVFFVMAQTPNPGHAFAELDGVQAVITSGSTACSGADLSIKTINPTTGAVTCETDDVGTSGITTCRIVQDSSSLLLGLEIKSIASCNSNEIRTGGGGHCSGGADWGLQSGEPLGTYPDPNNNLDWITTCYTPGGLGPIATSFAICCS